MFLPPGRGDSMQHGDDDDDDDDRHYPDIPGFVADSHTSAAAAAAADTAAFVSLANWCEQWFKQRTELGQLETCDALELAAKAAGRPFKHQSISPRIRTDLFINRQSIYKIGFDKITGKEVKVWYTTDTSNLLTNKKGMVIYKQKPTSSGRPAWVYGWGHPPLREWWEEARLEGRLL